MHIENDTIAAFSTPPGESGLAVLRISGKDAASICGRLFTPAGRRFPVPSEMKGYTMAPGTWDGIDDVVLACFRTPHSYTGEDVFEVYCHGGKAIREAVLAGVLACGARAAGPGEFSRRAFLNGKMDLASAEAVMDMIGAQAEKQAKAAFRQLKGEISRTVRARADQLYAVLARMEMLMDWDEEEERTEDRRSLSSDLRAAAGDLERLASGFRSGRVVREGLNVVIAGSPNVGKSSLLNMLCGKSRSIVSDIPGTTRDTVDIDLTLDGYLLHLTDTAGFAYQSHDPVEREGIVRAGKALEDADVVLWVLSPPLPPPAVLRAQEERIGELIEKGVPTMLILGKDDLRSQLAPGEDPARYAAARFPDLPSMTWSARNDSDRTRLKAVLVGFIERGGFETHGGRTASDDVGGTARPGTAENASCEDAAPAPSFLPCDPLRGDAAGTCRNGAGAGGEALLTHARHKAAIDRALELVRRAVDDLEGGLSFDLTAITVREAVSQLAVITGDDVSETLIETIFSRFCIGK